MRIYKLESGQETFAIDLDKVIALVENRQNSWWNCIMFEGNTTITDINFNHQTWKDLYDAWCGTVEAEQIRAKMEYEFHIRERDSGL